MKKILSFLLSALLVAGVSITPRSVLAQDQLEPLFPADITPKLWVNFDEGNAKNMVTGYSDGAIFGDVTFHESFDGSKALHVENEFSQQAQQYVAFDNIEFGNSNYSISLWYQGKSYGGQSSCYDEGINPVGIMIESEDVRTVRGGTGYAKCGGNYAASTRAGERAAKKGYSQVLWLDGVERKYVEEVGAMNVMFKINGEIVTPMLTGSILPGITRKSCIEVLQSLGYKVNERLLSIDELLTALKDGALEEAWG